MNFLCHALPTIWAATSPAASPDSSPADYVQSMPLQQRVLAVCTGVPDLLSVIDRKIRARARAAEPFAATDDPVMRGVAEGIVAHVADDRWFHGGETFVRMNLEFAVALRDRLPGDAGFRPSFLGHILIEMLLDANYVALARHWSDRYYALFESVPMIDIECCVNRITGKPSDRIATTLRRFADARFIEDYVDDEAMLKRLNQVMTRVGLDSLPDSVASWLPEARTEVLRNHTRLLSYPGQSTPYPPLG